MGLILIGCNGSSSSAAGSGTDQPGPPVEVKRSTFSMTLPGTWREVNFGSASDLSKLREVWKNDPNGSSMLDQLEAAYKQGALQLYALEDASSSAEFKANVNAIWLKADKPQKIQDIETGNLNEMRPMMEADPKVTWFKANGSDAYCMRGDYKAPNGAEVHISSVVVTKGNANLTVTFACPKAKAASEDVEVDKIIPTILMN